MSFGKCLQEKAGTVVFSKKTEGTKVVSCTDFVNNSLIPFA